MFLFFFNFFFTIRTPLIDLGLIHFFVIHFVGSDLLNYVLWYSFSSSSSTKEKPVATVLFLVDLRTMFGDFALYIFFFRYSEGKTVIDNVRF